MLSILADVLLIATGHRPDHKHPTRSADTDWNDRFISSRLRGLDQRSRRINPGRDLDW